jgi:hypothetical protein
MEFDKAMAPVRPILGIIGSVLIVAGLAKFFGVNIGIGGGGLEIAVAGWLMKSI